LAQTGLGGPKRLLRTMSVGDVDAFDEDRGDVARRVLDGLEDEIEITRLRGATGRLLKGDFHVFSDKRLTRCEDAVEQANKALPLNLGNSLANGQADHIAMPDQLLIGGVGQHEPMVGTLKERREAGRLDKHLPQPTNLFIGIK